ncbi:histone-lysine n-methyltransferase [Lasius niger]|uniref:Histone-lysine n-methyltransferase n=1 Tax=Lasius niger TaxID=67767 RepID=A0A0J7K085_LASNI|nr:histone-lysine n-methyltransferase [Lasius niger]
MEVVQSIEASLVAGLKKLELQEVEKWSCMIDCVVLSQPYSPDLTLSDFYLFGPLKDALRGTRFEDDKRVIQAVRTYDCMNRTRAGTVKASMHLYRAGIRLYKLIV